MLMSETCIQSTALIHQTVSEEKYFEYYVKDLPFLGPATNYRDIIWILFFTFVNADILNLSTEELFLMSARQLLHNFGTWTENAMSKFDK